MAKKSYRDQLQKSASQFVSTGSPEETPATPTGQAKPKEAPEGYKVNPEYIEKKTRRVQLLMRPSLYEQVKARADADGYSVNEYIHTMLEQAIEEEK
jgi:hypothetical protein